MKISSAYLRIALYLQESADEASNKDVCKLLYAALADVSQDDGQWRSYADHIGDNESGDVIYQCGGDGDLYSAPYEIQQVGGKLACKIDDEEAVEVAVRHSYQPKADDGDHYAGMEEAFRRAGVYTELPLYERFIGKAERAGANEGSFAGKGKSFPILKPGDVSAAVHAMGRAGSGNYGMARLKSNIISIAKKKGWTKQLPKSWRGDDAKEAALPTPASALVLVESAATVDAIHLQEARADYEIKLIAPGKGSSAFYPAEVLKRDGPKVFAAGTHIYLNHPTTAEEAARPEGDVKNLAGVLTTAASYVDSHAKGPGLYARMKVFADHAATVEEKAPHIGMSIRASGVAESNKKQDGLPVLKELTYAASVDVVTKAGAGGMILTEAAKPSEQEAGMTLQEAQVLVNEAVTKATAPLIEGERRRLAREDAARILDAVSLPAAAKLRIIERALAALPLKDGVIDTTKFRELVIAEARAEGEYLSTVTGGGQVRGLGAPARTEEAEEAEEKRLRKEAKRLRKDAESLQESATNVFGRLMGNAAAAKKAAEGMVS